MNIPLLPNTVHLYEQLAEWKTRLRNTAGFSCATPPLPSIHVWEAGVNKVQLWCKGIMESCGKGGVIIPPSIIGLMLKRNSVTPAWRMLSCSCVVVLGLWRGAVGFRWLTLARLLLVRITNLPECLAYLRGQGWLVPKHKYALIYWVVWTFEMTKHIQNNIFRKKYLLTWNLAFWMTTSLIIVRSHAYKYQQMTPTNWLFALKCSTIQATKS